MTEAGGGTGLSELLGFSAEELAANRAGELSPRQFARLREDSARQRVRPGGRSRTLAITAAVVVVLVAAAVAPQLTGSHRKSTADVPFLVIAVILIALLMWRSVARAGRSVSQIGSGPVSQAEGVAKTRRYGGAQQAAGLATDPGGTTGAAGESRCELSIGGTRFTVSTAVLAAFTDGRAYRAYYVGQGPRATIMSAEQI